MIYLSEHHQKIVWDILEKHPYTFYAFGSRTRKNHRRLSDLDLCYFEDIPLREVSTILEDFEESNLPFEVDLVSWNRCDNNFKRLIAKDLVPIKVQTVNAEKVIAPYII